MLVTSLYNKNSMYPVFSCSSYFRQLGYSSTLKLLSNFDNLDILSRLSFQSGNLEPTMIRVNYVEHLTFVSFDYYRLHNKRSVPEFQKITFWFIIPTPKTNEIEKFKDAVVSQITFYLNSQFSPHIFIDEYNNSNTVWYKPTTLKYKGLDWNSFRSECYSFLDKK